MSSIYTDEIMNFRLCSVTRVNHKQACSDPLVDSYMIGKCEQDKFSAKIHKVRLHHLPSKSVEPQHFQCKDRKV
ncbi:MAG: hypothetical protein ACK56F_00230, partial [bacterium]